MKRYLFYHFPWQIMMIAIFIQSSISSIDIPDLYINWSDKLLHFICFGILALLMARSFSRLWPQTYFFWTILLAVLYAAGDEIHQYFVQGRSATIGDWLADTLGIIIFTTVYHFFFSKHKILPLAGDDRK